ncbi:MAG: TIGR03905 family TSCPD domain-containing protein [Fretibacterium sp.]|nr:TIGR03905 family TSCPD domain-containing protein [Fretibacterium sp.]
MASYAYTPQGVCSRQISFDIEDGKLRNVSFIGGCPGNLLAIGRLLEGADARDAARRLKGNLCGSKGTSCADQLAVAVEAALEQGQNPLSGGKRGAA